MKEFWKKKGQWGFGTLAVLCCLLLLAAAVSPAGRRKEYTQENARETNAKETEAPRIALTFDDGPSGKWTPLLLDGLKERGIKATFFLIGKNAREFPDIVKRLDEEGHLIGNHTYHHVQLSNLSKEQIYHEIMDTNELILSITGKETEYIRPPFGVWPDGLEERFEVMPVMWSVDPLDWTTENTDEIVNKVVTETKENDIILLHDCYESSVKAALRSADILMEKGFEFVTVDELLID